MRDRIATIAKENGRSMNAEIVARLAASLDAHDSMDEAIERLNSVTANLRGIIEQAARDAATLELQAAAGRGRRQRKVG